MTEFAHAPAGARAEAARVSLARTGEAFWRSHFFWPMAVIVPTFCLIEWFGLDRKLAHSMFYDSALHRWLGNAPNDWWARGVIHNGGRWLCRSIAGTALVMWLMSFVSARARPWRRTAGFVLAALALSMLIVGGLKAITNIDCPWDLAEFGGSRPYITLFGDRPDALKHAECFPGAHSSSGFALVCFYFVFRDRTRWKAWLALATGIAMWMVFAFGQEARGAHFISHDLAGAAIVWAVQLLIYARWIRPRAAPAHGQ